MQYRPFGKTGVNVSALGFGCMRLPEIQREDGSWMVDQEKTDAMLRHAYDLGVNYFDTALFYCHENSEIAVGKALKPIRDKVYIDEFIEPCIFDNNGNIEEGDSVIWANFRPDRAIQILSALTNSDFNEFEVTRFKNLYLTTMMYVSDDIKSDIAFKKDTIDNTLGIYLSKQSKSQLRIAETEKYAHVTYFFDGGRNLELDGCRRILIPSPKVPTYDIKPQMSAYEITDKLLTEMDNNYDFILLNFANGDMVGHTGNYDATIEAVETVDSMLGKLYNKCKDEKYILIITADHGNCESMMDKENNIITSHTTNKVPFIVCNKNANIDSVDKLSDIAPFILNLMNLKIPNEMK